MWDTHLWRRSAFVWRALVAGDGLLARDDSAAAGGLRPGRMRGDLAARLAWGDLLRRGDRLRLLRRAGNGDWRRPIGDLRRAATGDRDARRATGDLEAPRRNDGEREEPRAAARAVEAAAAFPLAPPPLLLNLSVREREFSRLPSDDETERRALRRVNDTDLRRDEERAVAPPPTGEVGADGEYMVARPLGGCALAAAPPFFDDDDDRGCGGGDDDLSFAETLLLSLSSFTYSSL